MDSSRGAGPYHVQPVADLPLSSLGTALRSSAYSDAILHICSHRHAGKRLSPLLYCVFFFVIPSSSWPMSCLCPPGAIQPPCPPLHFSSSSFSWFLPCLQLSLSFCLTCESFLSLITTETHSGPILSGRLCLFPFLTVPPHRRFRYHVLSAVTTSSALFRCLVR